MYYIEDRRFCAAQENCKGRRLVIILAYICNKPNAVKDHLINYCRVWPNFRHFSPCDGGDADGVTRSFRAHPRLCLDFGLRVHPSTNHPSPPSPSVYSIPDPIHDLAMNSADFGGEGPSVPEALKPLMAQYEKYSRMLQYQVDRTTPHTVNRWIAIAGLNALFLLRIVMAQGVSCFSELPL